MILALLEACVRRRYAVLLLALVVALLGLRAYLLTPIEAYPDVTNAQVQVITQMPGLAAEEIERQVTVPLERTLNGTPGMKLIRSESLFGLSLVTLTFGDEADPLASRTQVSQRLQQAELPEGVIPTLGPEATPLGKIYRFRLASDRHDLYQLRAEMEWNLTRVLRQVDGVADVVSWGGYLKEVQVEADPGALHAAGVAVADLEAAIAKANLNVGGGFLRHGDQELTLRGIGYLASVEDIKQVPLKAREGAALTVGDVASVKLAASPRRGSVGWNEQREVVEGLVLMRRGQNPSDVLDGVHARVAELNGGLLPAGMRVEVFQDRSTLVGHSLQTVHGNLLHGFVLVVAVVIPLSLLVAFLGLHAMGLPANLISMGAIDFGILVDGAVVLVESVLHAIRAGRPDSPRALRRLVVASALDVGRPTFYAMLIIIAALLPVFTLESVEGRIFRPLALTYTFALAGALLFSLTVVPALCALLFKPRHQEIREPAWIVKLREGYRAALLKSLGRGRVTVAVSIAVLLAGGWVASRLGTEFLPELDEGDLMVYTELPASVAPGMSQDILADIHARVRAFPETAEVLTEHGRPEDGTDNEGVNVLRSFVRLKPVDEWPAGSTRPALVAAMRASLQQIPGIRPNFSQPIKDSVEEAVAGVRGKVVLKVFGTDLGVMRQALQQARAEIQRIEGVTELDLYKDATTPQLRIELDRARLARAGVAVEDAARGIETALAGRVVTQFWEGERPVGVRLLLAKNARDDVEKVADLPIATPAGASVPLRELATLDIREGAAYIAREGNVRMLALKFNVQGRDAGSVTREAMDRVREKVPVPPGHRFTWGGEFENQDRATQRLKRVVPVALLLVLGLLYAAMRSAWSALAILAICPAAMVGGAFALWAAGMALSVSAVIGFIALLGQVALMGVLLLSAANTRLLEGVPSVQAIVEGAVERLRPVLMASSLAFFGLLPMALSTGVGSEVQRPFAIVIGGGMLTTLLAALFLLPTVYAALAARTTTVRAEAEE